MAPAAATSSAPTTTVSATSTPAPSQSSGDDTASIVAGVVFGVFIFAAIVILTLWLINRRRELNSLPPSHRPTATYRPFPRSSSTSSQSKGLLANVETSQLDDKSSMFSRDRSSSSATLAIYVPDHEQSTRRPSTSSLNLLPLQITPLSEISSPVGRAASNGSGGSRRSRISSRNGSDEESGEAQDLGVARTRPRSTSTASTRYYDPNSTPPAPPVPTLWLGQDRLSAADGSGSYQRV
ncbi:hypothetical protein AOQ84DRAFT_379103 [Glonium stellatum]|uniref:Uncharacterized protein n=1 Tax=Glonium stellatum TaxID=574774 RepID=A0A8E2EWK5_9PEZI|nr:hypothetical protein AOQ84DRAFT_379103 [Glonium stellatum]